MIITKLKFDSNNSTTKKLLAISASDFSGTKKPTANKGWARDDRVARAEACEVSLDCLHSNLGTFSEAGTAMRGVRLGVKA